MILVIDNYDSFTYNLVQYVGYLTSDIIVYKNDEITISEIKTLNPERIIVSPGPGRPEKSMVSIDVVQNFKDTVPILGICLGHQVIGVEFGMDIGVSKNIFHGKTSNIFHDKDPIFNGIPSPFKGNRYHSLVLEDQKEIDELTVIARTDDNLIMGIKYKKGPVYGLQFHPESILTDYGKLIIKNFIKCI